MKENGNNTSLFKIFGIIGALVLTILLLAITEGKNDNSVGNYGG